MGTAHWTVTVALLLLVSCAGGCVAHHPPEVTVTREPVCPEPEVDLVCVCCPSATTCYCDEWSRCTCRRYGAAYVGTRLALSRPVRRAVRRQAHRTGHQVNRQAKRTTRQVKKQAHRTGHQVNRQAKRTTRQVKKQAHRSGHQINRETKRTSRRVSKQFKRTGRDLKKFFKKLF